jgi:hypothetical protein
VPLLSAASWHRACHARYSLRAERQAIMQELQQEMGAVKGGREFAQQRQQHAEDVQAIGARLRSLQSYVETAEAELVRRT